jgi:S1-C subfamily serine protease
MNKQKNKDRSNGSSREHNNLLKDDDAKKRAHTKKAQQLKLQLGILGALLIAAALLGGFMFKTIFHKSDSNANNSLQKALQIRTAASSLKTVNSNLGFSITYDSVQAHATGLQDGGVGGGLKTYTGTDLDSVRDYGVVQFYSYNKSGFDASKASNPIWQMEIITNLQKNIFEQGRQKYGQNVSDSDLAAKLFAPKATTNSYTSITPTQTLQQQVKIGTINYIKTVYKMEDKNFAVASHNLVVYSTVQNGRPYAVQLDFDNRMTAEDIAPLIRALNNITYSKPNPSVPYLTYSGAVYADVVKSSKYVKLAASTTDPALPKDVLNTPNHLSDADLNVVARNQPGVVRIGTVNCFDFDLLYPTGKTAMVVKGACSAGAGSGSIVSEDGYVSTNGHVTVGSPSNAFQYYIGFNSDSGDVLNNYIQYLADTGLASFGNLDSLVTAIKNGDQAAFQTLLSLTATIPEAGYKIKDARNEYAVQLSDEPIKLNTKGSVYSFDYDQYVVRAKFVDSNFDITGEKDGAFDLSTYKSSDVSILKMDGSRFPVIRLGALSDIQKGSGVIALGFPGFVDGALDTKQAKTIPTATSGAVSDIYTPSAGAYELISATIPIAQGNSGGPVLNSNGLQVGLATYSGQSLDPKAGIEKLSEGSYLRNVDDFKALLTKNKINISTTSEVTTLWNGVIDDFVINHYKHAKTTAEKIQALYPNTYLTGSFIKTAQTEIVAGHDRSGIPKLIIYAVVAGFLMICIIIGIIITVIKASKHRTVGVQLGYYPPPVNPATATTWQNQAVQATYSNAQQNAAMPITPMNNGIPAQPQVYGGTVAPTVIQPQVINPEPQVITASPVYPAPTPLTQPTQQVITPMPNPNDRPPLT